MLSSTFCLRRAKDPGSDPGKPSRAPSPIRWYLAPGDLEEAWRNHDTLGISWGYHGGLYWKIPWNWMILRWFWDDFEMILILWWIWISWTFMTFSCVQLSLKPISVAFPAIIYQPSSPSQISIYQTWSHHISAIYISSTVQSCHISSSKSYRNSNVPTYGSGLRGFVDGGS